MRLTGFQKQNGFPSIPTAYSILHRSLPHQVGTNPQILFLCLVFNILINHIHPSPTVRLSSIPTVQLAPWIQAFALEINMKNTQQKIYMKK
jgi:hypothetical protein